MARLAAWPTPQLHPQTLLGMANQALTVGLNFQVSVGLGLTDPVAHCSGPCLFRPMLQCIASTGCIHATSSLNVQPHNLA